MKITIATLTDEPFLIEVNEDLEIDNLKSLCEEYVAIPKTEMQILHDGVPLMHETKTLRGYGIQENDILVVQRMRGQQQQRGTSQGNQALAGRPSAPRPAVPAAAAASGQGMLPVIDFSNIQVPGALGALQPMVGSSLASSTQRRPSIPSSGAQGAGAAAAAASTDHRFVEEALALRNRLLGMPHEIALLRERNPQLAEALMSGIPDRFVEVLRRQREQMSRQQMERIRMLNSDPFDSDVQRRIAEEIQQRNVDDNMESAIEFMPEAFGHVVMLYINCNVNGHNVKAFVDSGAQMTIMSQACAVRCGIMRLVDTRWAGIAKGVGTQKIIGRVHLSQIKIENAFLNSSFAILEEQPMDMLLGLDMLRRHQCCIDLTRNILTIGTTGTETSFLPESELPEHARLHQSDWVTGGDAAPDDDGQMAIAMERSHDEAQKRTHNAAESTSAGVGLSESAIAQLTQMGFSRESVVQELRQAGGDVDQALAALLAQSNAEGMF